MGYLEKLDDRMTDILISLMSYDKPAWTTVHSYIFMCLAFGLGAMTLMAIFL